MKQRTHKIKTAGGMMNVVDCGPDALEGATPILLVHGFPLDHSMWTHQIEYLSQNFRLLCPDLLGCGRSDPIDGATSMRLIADELAEVLDQLKVGPVAYCGLSMGGYVGWQFCKHHRSHVSHLIASNTRATADDDIVQRGRRMMAKTISSTGSKELANNMVEKLFLSTEASKKEIEMVHATIASTRLETIAEHQLAMAARPDMSDFISSIDFPTLVIAGEGDDITPADEMRTMAHAIPNARFHCIARSGHLTPLEQSDDFNRAVEQFLN